MKISSLALLGAFLLALALAQTPSEPSSSVSVLFFGPFGPNPFAHALTSFFINFRRFVLTVDMTPFTPFFNCFLFIYCVLRFFGLLVRWSDVQGTGTCTPPGPRPPILVMIVESTLSEHHFPPSRPMFETFIFPQQFKLLLLCLPSAQRKCPFTEIESTPFELARSPTYTPFPGPLTSSIRSKLRC